MLPEKHKKTYTAFYDSTVENDILDEKTTVMIQLASAFAIACYPWMEHFLGVAKEKGLSDNEIGAIQSIVMGVSAGRIRAQFREVRERIEYDEQ
jgi:alkylhydroperoxidase/carboxymuconolactone decarboxylase family protein YurZ